MAWDNTKFAYRGSQRTQGAVQVINGGLEVAGATLLSGTGVGAVVGLPVAFHGGDNIGTGLRRLWTGEAQNTVTYNGVAALTGSQKAAAFVDNDIPFAGGVANIAAGINGFANSSFARNSVVEVEANALQRIGLNNLDNANSIARMARIDELSRLNYERRINEAINNQEYVFRYLSEDGLNASLKYGSIRGYTTTEFTSSSSAISNGAQILPEWGVPKYGVAIPVDELNGFSIARPMGGKATTGWEVFTNSYPKAGSGGFSQFLLNAVPIDRTHIFRLNP